jgi:hypothetical protein
VYISKTSATELPGNQEITPVISTNGMRLQIELVEQANASGIKHNSRLRYPRGVQPGQRPACIVPDDQIVCAVKTDRRLHLYTLRITDNEFGEHGAGHKKENEHKYK